MVVLQVVTPTCGESPKAVTAAVAYSERHSPQAVSWQQSKATKFSEPSRQIMQKRCCCVAFSANNSSQVAGACSVETRPSSRMEMRAKSCAQGHRSLRTDKSKQAAHSAHETPLQVLQSLKLSRAEVVCVARHEVQVSAEQELHVTEAERLPHIVQLVELVSNISSSSYSSSHLGANLFFWLSLKSETSQEDSRKKERNVVSSQSLLISARCCVTSRLRMNSRRLEPCLKRIR